MNCYYFDLAGLALCLQTPQPVTISENLRPFAAQPHTKPDCTIALQSCHALPPLSEGGVWNGPEYYLTDQNVTRVFHCLSANTQPFAVTQLWAEGDIQIQVLPEYLSYFSGTGGIFNRIGMETLLLQHHGLLLHASLIKFKDMAIAFTGPSGVGKSTQAQLWHSCLGARILNGDRAIIRKTNAGVMAYGSPYAGTSGIFENDAAPLRAIVVLRQGPENQLRPMTQTEAIAAIYPELSLHRWDPQFVARATDLCLQLLAQTPVYLLQCLPDESAVALVKKGLSL